MKLTKCSNRKCGWIGDESDRREVYVSSGWTELRCPRCNCDSFYSVKPGESEKPKTGSQLIALERDRQMKIEGWTPKHDDTHKKHELAEAAICYVKHTKRVLNKTAESDDSKSLYQEWPSDWDFSWWKPSNDPVRNLVKAGALIAAEIDRIQRLKEGSV